MNVSCSRTSPRAAVPLLDDEEPSSSFMSSSGAAASASSSNSASALLPTARGPGPKSPEAACSTPPEQVKVLATPPRTVLPPATASSTAIPVASAPRPPPSSALAVDKFEGMHADDKPRALHRVKTIDAFALKEKPRSVGGGLITVIVVIAVIAYTVYTVVSWVNRPWINNSTTQWTYRNGPWDMRVRCRAASGCWVSNKVTQEWAEISVPASQQLCTFLSPGDWTTVGMTFSNNPNEGFSAVFVPGHSGSAAAALPAASLPQTQIPAGFGLEIESSIVCTGEGACVDGVQPLLTPIAGGLNLLFLVETTNNSASGAGAFRREWYPTQIANLNNSGDVAVVAAATTCDAAARFGDAAAGWVQARVRLSADFAQVTVSRDALWLVLWGTVGGALSLFMQIGGVVLAMVSIVMQRMAARTQVRDEEQG